MAIGDFVEDVGEPGLRIHIVYFAGFDQRSVDGPISRPVVRTGEQVILATESNRPVILPISAMKSKSITVGIRFMGAAFADSTASGGAAARVFTSRRHLGSWLR